MWELEPELLILEVESRPILYVKSLPEYANKPLKNDAWEEVAKTLSCDWESLLPAEKNKRCKEVQSKWKHIRDNFRREYQAQKYITSGQGAKKRKKIYSRNKEKGTFEYEILKMMKDDMTIVDEDKTFCISLVPSLKKMDDDKKIAAKIDILKVIRQYSGYSEHISQVDKTPSTSTLTQ
ncbi:uncharacterized protein LOC134745822 [Cydia strobilella]|uniref:uncharacterized protein LOC134745822 n=1 Tax=Cydia strobilella TaxID=1100964 RepID=UPI003003D68E